MQLGQPTTALPGMGFTLAAFLANAASYARLVAGGYAIAQIGLQVGTSSGNISVGAYTASGTGHTATPTGGLLASSGAVPCPASGFALVSLGATIVPLLADWFAASTDNATATFGIVNSSSGQAIEGGLCYTQSTAHPLPATPSGLTANRVVFWLKGF